MEGYYLSDEQQALLDAIVAPDDVMNVVDDVTSLLSAGMDSEEDCCPTELHRFLRRAHTLAITGSEADVTAFGYKLLRWILTNEALPDEEEEEEETP